MADQAIDAIIAAAPGHTPGTRPIHAPGIGVTGHFQASDVARLFSDAVHFSGRPVPATVRFSNGTGSVEEPDSAPLVRGMAVRFHLGGPSTGEGGLPHEGEATDMVCMTLPVFFTRTVDDFMDFLDSVRQTPVRPTPRWPTRWWNSVAGGLRLQPGPSRPPHAGEAGALEFANRYPPARQSIVALTALSVPQSYATCTYHAVHAFVLTAGDRITAVRFRWEPVAGVRSAATGTEGDFLRQELRDRLSRGPAEFVLRMQVGEQGDDTSDPTKPWPEARRRVVMGHLRLEAVAGDQIGENERMTFDPTRLVPGIGLSDDAILRSRHEVYERSSARRQALSPG